MVRVGKNLRFSIGYLKYDIFKPFSLPAEAITMIAIGILLFVFFFLGILFIYRRKSTQAEREYKRIQIQMDTLESNVRSECKLGNYFYIHKNFIFPYYFFLSSFCRTTNRHD